MTTKEELLKRLYDARLACYKHHLNDDRQATIAAQFALEDFVSQMKRTARDINEECAMEQLVMEVEDIEEAANGYRNS